VGETVIEQTRVADYQVSPTSAAGSKLSTAQAMAGLAGAL